MNSKTISFMSLIVLSILLFWAGTQLSLPKTSSPLDTEYFLNYVIPKLEKFVPRFSLWNRKFIERKKLAPRIVNVPLPTSSPQSQQKPLAVSSPTAVATPTPTSNPNPTVANNPSKANSDSTSTQAIENSNPEESDLTENDPSLINPFASGANTAAGPSPTETPTPELQVKDWIARIQADPTKDTVNELLFEYQTGKLSKDTFYKIIVALVEDPNSYFHKLALYALAATPSLDSLSVILKNTSRWSPTAKAMYNYALEGYAKAEKFKILELALRSSNRDLILGTMPIVLKIASKMTLWVADYSSTVGERRARGERGPTNGIPKPGFLKVVDALSELQKSSDGEISTAAHETLLQLNYSPETISRRD